jgi:cyclase
MPLTVGGGVKAVNDIKKLLYSGADKVSINSAAIYDPNLIEKASNRFGKQCIVIAIDAKKTIKKNCNSGYEVFSHGGTKDTSLDVVEWAKKCEELGAGEILLTSMDNDGTKKGFNIDLTNKVTQSIKIPVRASGGVGDLAHFTEGACKTNATGLLAASVFHFGKFTINQVKKELYKNGVPVRI